VHGNFRRRSLITMRDKSHYKDALVAKSATTTAISG
jgi:hypothetical protein